MRSGKRRSILPFIYVGSVVAHVAFAAVAVLLPKPERTEAVAIELADIKKKKPPPKPPPPAPPPPRHDKPKPPPRPAAPAQAKVDRAPAKVEPAAPPVEMGADGFADLGGVSLGGGGDDGVALGGPSIATAGPARSMPAPKTTARKVEQLAPAVAQTCSDPVVRPKRRTPVPPKYTMQARQAEIEGVVKVEVTVDETGRVIAAHVLSGLGYGLDESAVKAAIETVFEPARQCGKAVVGKVILPFRFEST